MSGDETRIHNESIDLQVEHCLEELFQPENALNSEKRSIKNGMEAKDVVHALFGKPVMVHSEYPGGEAVSTGFIAGIREGCFTADGEEHVYGDILVSPVPPPEGTDVYNPLSIQKEENLRNKGLYVYFRRVFQDDSFETTIIPFSDPSGVSDEIEQIVGEY